MELNDIPSRGSHRSSRLEEGGYCDSDHCSFVEMHKI